MQILNFLFTNSNFRFTLFIYHLTKLRGTVCRIVCRTVYGTMFFAYVPLSQKIIKQSVLLTQHSSNSQSCFLSGLKRIKTGRPTLAVCFFYYELSISYEESLDIMWKSSSINSNLKSYKKLNNFTPFNFIHLSCIYIITYLGVGNELNSWTDYHVIFSFNYIYSCSFYNIPINNNLHFSCIYHISKYLVQ